MTDTTTNPSTWCGICGSPGGDPFCEGCTKTLADKAEAERAAQTRALVGDTIAEALRAHLTTLSQHELLAAEHRAQIRTANAEQGAVRIAERVRAGIHFQASLDAATDEMEAARHVLGLVHEAQQVELALRQAAEADAEGEALCYCVNNREDCPNCNGHEHAAEDCLSVDADGNPTTVAGAIVRAYTDHD